MGTRGLRVYCHKGWYYVYYNHHDSYPEGLGVQILAEIPVGNEEAYTHWLCERRERLDRRLAENQDQIDKFDEDWYITKDIPEGDDFIEWIYTIDLDHEVFLVDNYPLFSLRNMPNSDNLFCESIAFDSYGHRGYSPSTPKQHIYEWKSAPPRVEDSLIKEYTARHDASKLTIVDLLGTTLEASDAESARIGLLEAVIGGHMQPTIFGVNFRHLETISDRADIPRFLLCWGEHVLRLAFGRMLLGYDEKAAVTAPTGLDFWLASDVFVRMATHLDDERNLKKNIIDIVDEIASKRQAPALLYGVLFSFFHCVILEVDAQNRFKSTSVLQFLPFLYTASPSTPGIAAIARLAHHRLSPLDLFDKESIPLPPGHFLSAIPLDVLEAIAAILDPASLQNLYSAAPVFKPAAERLLRYPHIEGYRLDRLIAYSEPNDDNSRTEIGGTNINRPDPRLIRNIFSAWVDGTFVPEFLVRVSRIRREQSIVATADGQKMVLLGFAAAVRDLNERAR